MVIRKLLKRSCPTYPKYEKVASCVRIRKLPPPESFFRGFSSGEIFSSEGIVLPGAFDFKAVQNRKYLEASINWNDDRHSLRILCEQRSEKQNNDFQFKYGYSELSLSAVLMLLKPYSAYFGHERAPLKGNPYHGNLLVRSDLSKQSRRMISNSLAAIASLSIHKHPSQDNTLF